MTFQKKLFTILFLSNFLLFFAQKVKTDIVIDTIIKIEEEKKLLKNFSDNGYFNNEVITFQKKTDSTYHYKIDLKNKTSYIEIDINSIQKELKNKFKNYEFFKYEKDKILIQTANFNMFTNLLKNELDKLGLLFADYKFEKIKYLNNRIYCSLQITQGKERTIDKVVLNNYKKFPKSFVKHHLNLKKGKKINENKINTAYRAVNQLQFANNIRKPELLFKSDSTIVNLFLKREKRNSIDGFIGFGNNPEKEKINVNGNINLDFENNLNSGERIQIKYRKDENEQTIFDSKVNLPYIFNTPFDIKGEINYLKKDSSFVNFSQNINLGFSIDYKQKIYLGTSKTTSDNISTTISNVEEFENNFYNLNYIFSEKTNSLINPLLWHLDLKLKWGKRNTNSTETLQKSYELSFLKTFNINNRNFSLIKINTKQLISDNYLENEIYRFGGNENMRGFEENSILANYFITLNTEYNYMLNSKLSTYSIIDFGYFENQKNNIYKTLNSFGIGLGVFNKKSTIKINYVINNSRTEKQLKGKINVVFKSFL